MTKRITWERQNEVWLNSLLHKNDNLYFFIIFYIFNVLLKNKYNFGIYRVLKFHRDQWKSFINRWIYLLYKNYVDNYRKKQLIKLLTLFVLDDKIVLEVFIWENMEQLR